MGRTMISEERANRIRFLILDTVDFMIFCSIAKATSLPSDVPPVSFQKEEAIYSNLLKWLDVKLFEHLP